MPARSEHQARTITSPANERVKFIRALAMRKVRRETGLFVAEGAFLLQRARAAGWSPTMLVFLAGGAPDGVRRDLVRWAQAAGGECLEVSRAVLAKIAAKENPQTMLGVFAQRFEPPPRPARAREPVWLALEAVRDPGNLGTIIRTADAVRAGGVVLIGSCCDPFSREAVRATMGSIFAVPLVPMDAQSFGKLAAEWHGDVVGAHLAAREDFRAVLYRAPTLLVMGSEGSGLSEEVAKTCRRLVKIPMAGELNSLNLAVAAGLLLYEIRRPQLRI
jgi:TrmH family RNA methyltransferase